MSTSNAGKLLVALDGSNRSRLTVDHISACQPLHAHRLVLYHVFNKIPYAYYDLQKEPKSIKIVGQTHAWESHQKKKIASYLEKAKGILIQEGFAESDIDIKISPRDQGIARDIIKESRNGYTAVILRRRGTTHLPLIMGGVATKVVERNDAIPMIITGRKPAAGKVLIAIDGSSNALRAADFAGRMLAGHKIGIHLVSIVRGVSATGSVDSGDQTEREDLAASPDEATKKILEAREHLLQAGVSSQQVTWQLIADVHSRAEAIVAEADSKGCDTIIVGRRGHSRINYFFIGSVSAKVIQLGRQHTVWVIP